MDEEREININSPANINPMDFIAFSSSMPSGSTMHNFLQVPPHSAQPSPMHYPVAPQTPHSQQISNAMHIPGHERIQTAEHSLSSHQLDQFIQLQNRHLELFWQHQRLELDNLEGYKQHHLPLARIRRIMKMEGDAQMVSADTPMMFSKACEYFISELTIRSWLHAERCKRQTIKRSDIAGAVCSTEMMDFLIDILPHEEIQDHIATRQHQVQQPNMANHGHILNRP